MESNVSLWPAGIVPVCGHFILVSSVHEPVCELVCELGGVSLGL